MQLFLFRFYIYANIGKKNEIQMPKEEKQAANYFLLTTKRHTVKKMSFRFE